jgi:hypothetical protein
LQEVLADRWAAFCYGAAAFTEGLRHVVDRSIRFEAHANAVLREAVERRKALVNLYSAAPAAFVPDETALAGEFEQALNRQPSAYDSHPRPVDRFAWVEALGAQGGPEEPDDCADAWSLFDDREALEREFTEDIMTGLRALEVAEEDKSVEDDREEGATKEQVSAGRDERQG